MKTLAVDGNNILMRSIHAMNRKELSAHGVPTGAVMTFVNMLSRYIREEEPDKVIVCWDGGFSSYREAIYPDYKASRKKMTLDQVVDMLDPKESDQESAFGLAKTFLDLSNIPHVEVPGVEADDIIAFYWWNSHPDDEFVILSGDKDFLQLVGDGCVQIRPGSSAVDEKWDAARVVEKFGVTPEQLTIVMAMSGDKVDSVPGIPHVGMKTAVRVLNKNEWSIDAVFANEKKFVGHLDTYLRNLSLINLRNYFSGLEGTLRKDIPDFDPTVKGSPLWVELLRFVDNYELWHIKGRFVQDKLWRNA